jgi:hypothetical protein
MTDEAKLAEDEDTEASRESWLHHQHTKKRLIAQRKEVEQLQNKLHSVAVASSDPEVRWYAALLTAAERFEHVLKGID